MACFKTDNVGIFLCILQSFESPVFFMIRLMPPIVDRCSSMGLFACMTWCRTYQIGRGST